MNAWQTVLVVIARAFAYSLLGIPVGAAIGGLVGVLIGFLMRQTEGTFTEGCLIGAVEGAIVAAVMSDPFGGRPGD